MKPNQRGKWVFGLLLGAWLLAIAWQIEEHHRVVEAAKSDLRHRSHGIALDLSAVTQALAFRSAVIQDRLEPVLRELVSNQGSSSVRLLYLGLLNTDGQPIVAEGNTNLFSGESLTGNELWTATNVIFVWPMEGASVTNNPMAVLPAPHMFTNDEQHGFHGPDFHGPEPRPGMEDGHHFDTPPPTNFPPPMTTNANGEVVPMFPPDDDHHFPPHGDHPRNNHRPPWLRYMSDADFKNLVATHELHGLVLAMSTENVTETSIADAWLRGIIIFFAGVSALIAGLAWRNVAKTADLQIRLVRASELNSHLKEMNLAAAGLAHETRNPLNIIRGQAQILARLDGSTPDVREKSKTIVDETDKVTAQLTEFINYSRPREVRPTRIALAAACNEVVRTLSFDIEEKKLNVTVGGDILTIQADEQLLRQVLFNLLMNAIQAVEAGGHIQIMTHRSGVNEATLEVRDDGPGVALNNREEIFKPYFTTHQKGTGLGLAVVQQNVLAHGWEIAYLANDPRGAIFRITHLKITA